MAQVLLQKEFKTYSSRDVVKEEYVGEVVSKTLFPLKTTFVQFLIK